eukprot:12934041-Prorocentrum_lima.AAC.1
MARHVHASFRKHCEQVDDIHRTRAHDGPIAVAVCAQVVCSFSSSFTAPPACRGGEPDLTVGGSLTCGTATGQ